ncbi:MAG: ROK family protein [Planctomycetota bacterium]
MATEKEAAKPRRYLGVDVGGTKIQASLMEESGTILGRHRVETPQKCSPKEVVAAIEEAMETVVRDAGLPFDDVTALGLAIPGVVDPDKGYVVVTPNMNLTGTPIGPDLQERFKIPVAVGNDCDLGTLGEAWLGSARNAPSAVGILVGTGIGSGIVYQGKPWRGAREAAAEIGHIVMEIGGPKCGCGNKGCFEALAGRAAIQRDLCRAIDKGKKTVLTKDMDADQRLIKSGALRRALEAEDDLVTEVMRRASEVLGHACLTVRHLLDPEVIVLGGGVVEACYEFIMPIVRKIVDADKLPGARESTGVLLSALGDDAVVLGALALARRQAGRDPFDKRFAVKPTYPKISGAVFGEVTVGQETYDRDLSISVNGEVKKRKRSLAKKLYGSSHTVGPRELERVCQGGPAVLFVGTGHSGQLELTGDAVRFLSQRLIECRALPTPEAAEAYNRSGDRKAALIHVTC